MEFKFNVTGQDRKRLVGAISELLNVQIQYLGAPTFAYEIGYYHIDKTGTVTGEYSLSLMAGLEARGFEYEASKTFHFITPRGTFLIQAIYGTAAEAEADGYGIYFTHNEHDVYIKTNPDGATEHSKLFALVGEPLPQPEKTEEPAADESDRLTVEVPNDFSPEQIDNLCKMVTAKEPLLKKALGTEELPVRVLEDTIEFPWFTLETPDDAAYYAQFIHALCATAKEKKRVTAKAPDAFENEKFSMRVWLIGLGLVGKEYGKTRKLLAKNLSGDSGWRYGKPDQRDAGPDAATPGNEDDSI